MEPLEIEKLLTALSVMSPRQRRAFFELVNKRQLRMIEEVFLNLLKNPVGIAKKDLATDKKYSEQIKKLANPDIAAKSKKKLLNQRGGFLGAILPILGSLLASFITK